MPTPASTTVCLDFDDTLRAHGGAPEPGVREGLVRLRAAGLRLVVSSARFSPIYGELNRHRIAKVRAWLEAEGIAVDDVALFVPRAGVYVDDLAYRFGGDWTDELPAILDHALPAWRSALTRPPRRGRHHARVSVDLAALWSSATGHPQAGAAEAMDELSRRGLEVVASAGPHFGLGCDAREAPQTSALLQQLRAGGLHVAKLQAEKISSQVYVSARGLRYAGDWEETSAQVLALLEAS